ncbi:MAG: glucuronate isomerase [Planctomycetota bacterium]|nr:glucuronate isomerase [Planctomycetota bacterium]
MRQKNPVTNPDFLLLNDAAKELYAVAAEEPIYDYHCHLAPEEIAQDRQWDNLTEVWLAGDHYKWRALRAAGVSEKYITGDASDYEKFCAFAETMPKLLRNPLWHWSHLELSRVFGIKEVLNQSTAQRIWDEANAQLGKISAQTLLAHFRVAAIGTTDDPCDSLSHHIEISKSELKTRVYPAFRPDKALAADDAELFQSWVQRLEQSSGISCNNFDTFLEAIANRHTFFHNLDSRLSDHGIEQCFGRGGTKGEAAEVYNAALRGDTISNDALHAYRGYMMVYFGELDASRKWTKQLHLGALRNTNSRGRLQLGADAGYDSIGDFPQVGPLVEYLDELDKRNSLPKMVLYNLNPADNYAVAAACGNFQGDGIPGKIQYGSGWWFLDQLDGMRWQINTLSQIGLLSTFVGMLTDSRSFLSYPRHEYFRRLLCNIIGNDVEQGLLPNDIGTIKNMVRGISYGNAVQYFEMEAGEV